MNKRYPKSTPGHLIAPLFEAHSLAHQHRATIQGRSRYLPIESFVRVAIDSGVITTCKNLKDYTENMRQVLTTAILLDPTRVEKKKLTGGRVGYRYLTKI